MKQQRFRFGLRRQFILLSLTVLIIPYMGYDYLRKMEGYLRETLESALVDNAYAVAGTLNDKPGLFLSHMNTAVKNLYIHQLNHTVQLDGYIDDWMSFSDWSDTYSSDQSKDNYKLIISKDEHYYYVLMQVRDEHLQYASDTTKEAIDGDHIVIVYRDRFYRLNRLYFAPSGPGHISPFQYIEVMDEYGVETWSQKLITNTPAVWQETTSGFNLEIKIPDYLIGDYLGFVFNDIDSAKHKVDAISTAGPDTLQQPNRILLASPEVRSILHNLVRTEGRRIWVLDQSAQVMATDGSLRRVFPDNAFNVFYTLLLPPAHDYFEDDLAGASRLQGAEVKAALAGQTETRWRSSPDNKAVIVSVATPVWLNNKVVGAVMVEETTNNIQLLQRQVLANLFNKTLLILLVAFLVLLFYAGRLSSRLIKLNRDTAGVIDEYGKVCGEISASRADDEIGALSRSFVSMLSRLQHYHLYLEGMTSRLAHELKTPMAIVKTSLERLQNEKQPEQHEKIMTAAQEGVQRLQTILTRLSEASRLEQALRDAEKQKTILNDFLPKCVESYRLAYPDNTFALSISGQVIQIDLNDDLFMQMLDKLISNAVDFTQNVQPIEIDLQVKNNLVELTITNTGAALPDDMQKDLFNSMVSVRDKKDSSSPHLGLGLYIARLIAEFHNGVIKAANLPDNKVRLIITFQRFTSL